MERECLRCKVPMKEAFQATLPEVKVQRKEKGIKGAFAKTSDTSVFVL